MEKTADRIRSEIEKIPIINTHSHHLPDELFCDAGLEYLLKNSYTNWMSPPPALEDHAAVEEYIRRYRCNTYYRWLFSALERLYGLGVTAENFPELDRRIRSANADPGYHLKLLKNECRYHYIVNERQPNPGSDLGHPELFRPSFRCDCYFAGRLKDQPEPNGFYAYSTFGEQNIRTAGEYFEQMRLAVGRVRERGCAALKVAIAYERPIDFEKPDLKAAARAFNNTQAAVSDIIAFGDAVMFELARAAAENSLPLQIHTGMGQLRRTGPIGLLSLIEHNPDTKFHLLHGGFPWLADTYALLHNFKNVWSDTCWIPYLSSHQAVQYFITALEVSDAHRLTWGCDTWMSEDSYGALLAMEHTLSAALGSMADDGAIGQEDALYLAQRILYHNGKELFSL